MQPGQPEIFVLAGPNGAGKTTVAGLLLPERLGLRNFVNADYIAKAISPLEPDASAFQAGRHMLERMRDLRARRESFGFESTLASKTFAPFLRSAQADDYLVHILFVSLANPDLAVHRVRLRVQRGGHDIPEDVVRRRYARSLTNFFQIYLPLADSWSVCDNSGDSIVPVALCGAGSEPSVMDQARWKRLCRQGGQDGP